MSGLVLTLKPNEKFLVNGALLQNGPKRGQLRITNPDVNVLRMSDALHPSEINTPVKRVYYAAQLILSGDMKEDDVIFEITKGLEALVSVFEGLDIETNIRKALKAAYEGRFYSVLCSLRPVFAVENRLLEHMPASHDEPLKAMAG